MIYFDNAATTRVCDKALAAALPFLTDCYGNPSSTHKMGVVAKNAITHAREQCAKAINADPEQIIFTSGATESNNLVVNQFEYIIKSPYEHPSMYGREWGNLETDLNEADRAGVRQGLVSCVYVQSEIGTIFPVAEYAKIAHEHGWLFMTDCTQAFGHVPIDVKELDCDFLSISAHKVGGFKGVGILYIKDIEGFKDIACNLNKGGSQEYNIRSGTENVAGIVSAGVAFEENNYDKHMDRLFANQKQELIQGLRDKCPVNFIVNELKGYNHVNNICNISFENINSESLTILLNNADICVSTKTACHSGSIEPSATLKAIGTPDNYLYGSIRISLSVNNSLAEVEEFVDKVCELIKILKEVQ